MAYNKQNNQQGQEQEESIARKPWWRFIVYFAIALFFDYLFELHFWGGVISAIIVYAIGEFFLFNDDDGDDEQEEKGFSKWVYVALVIFVIFFTRQCACSSCSSDNSSSSNKSEMVHKGLYDQGFEMGYASSHGMPMSVDQAYDIWSEKVAGAPDSPTPEFVQGFYDGQAKK